MKKFTISLLALLQLLFISTLTAQTYDDVVCVGDVKDYYIHTDIPPYSNPSGTFTGGVDTTYEWTISNSSGTLNPSQIYNALNTVSWVAYGTVSLSLTETIKDVIPGTNDTTYCSKTNTISIQVFDTLHNGVIRQPLDQNTVLGGVVTFTSGLVDGTQPVYGSLTYQWQYSEDGISNWTPVGSNTSFYTFTVNNASLAGYYRCVVTTFCRTVTTNVALLYIRGVPVITTQPVGTSICEGAPVPVTFTCIATPDGDDVIYYQWQKSSTTSGPWINVPGATNSVYTINNPLLSDEGYYRCIVNSEAYPTINLISNTCYFDVIDNMVVYFTTNSVTCNGSNNGSIYVDSILNGQAPFNYLWSPGGQNTSSISNLAPGSYTVTITEGSSSGCTIQKTVEIDEPQPIRLGVDSSIWQEALWVNGQTNQSVEDIVLDKVNGNFVQVGSFETELIYDATSIFSANSGTYDMFVSKMTSIGTALWTRHAGGSNNTYGKAVGMDKNGNIYVGGSFKSTICFYYPDNTPGPVMTSHGFSLNNYDYDGYIVKYDANGNYINAITFGGLFNDYINDIHVNPDGQICITGSFEGEITIQGQTITSGAAANVFVAKFNNDLSLRWLKAIENQPYEQIGTSIVVDIADNTYISGEYQVLRDDLIEGDEIDAPLSNKDVFIARFDYNGNFKWLKTVNGPGFITNGSLAVDYSECVYHVGTFINQAQLKETDGTVIHNYVSAGGTDGFIQKFDRNGYLRWATTVGGTGNDTIKTVTTDVLGNTYIAGNFSGSLYFNENNIFTSAPNSTEAFVAKFANVRPTDPFTPSIPAVWGNVIRGNGHHNITTIEVDNDQNIFVGGEFSLTANFGDVVSFSANYPKDAFTAKLKEVYVPRYPYIIDAICPDDSTGFVQIYISGGTLPYTYVWSYEGEDTATLYNVSNGRYWYWIGDYYNNWTDTICGLHGSVYVNHLYNNPIKPQYITVDTNDFCAESLNPDQITLTAHTIPANLTDSIIWMQGSCENGIVLTAVTGHPATDEYTITIPAPTITTTYFAYWQSEFCGRSLCDSVTVIVRPLPIMPDSITVSDNNFCERSVDTLYLTAFGGSGLILEWLTNCDNDQSIIGTGTNISIPAPLDSTIIYARWKNACGVSSCQELSINVIPYPNSTIYNLAENYCSNEPVDTLVGEPAGGTWSGPGLTVISDYQVIFNPGIVPAGLVEILYTVNYEGCDSTYITQTTVYAAPVADFDNLDTTYCYYETTILLTGNFAPYGSFTCSVPEALQNIGDGTAIFNPSVAGVGGPYEIAYLYIDNLTGCSDTIIKTTKVVQSDVQIVDLPAEICSEELSFLIYGLIDTTFFGGTFYGEGISNLEPGIAIFDPDLPFGTYVITLIYTNVYGCTDTIEQSIEILKRAIAPTTVYCVEGNAFCYQTLDSITLAITGGEGSRVEWYYETCGQANRYIDSGLHITIPAPTQNTTYFVRWVNGCGPTECLELPIEVYILPDVTVTGKFDICQREITTIYSILDPDCNYIWKDVVTDLIIGTEDSVLVSPDDDRWFRLIAQNGNQCVDSIDFLVTVLELPSLELGEDLYLFTCDSVELTAGYGMGFDYYLWQDSSTEATYWVSETGTYYVTVYNDGCSITDSIYVELCTEKIFIPNAFSPNGDGLNDFFRPTLSDYTVKMEMYIYDRTGGLVTQTDNYSVGWDGKNAKGQDCPSGTYAYIIKYHMKIGKGRTLEKTTSGSVILLR